MLFNISIYRYIVPILWALVLVFSHVSQKVQAAGAATEISALPPEVLALWKKTRLSDQSLSVYVQEIGATAPIFTIQETVPRNPASVMKLVTTYTGLQLLGPSWQWTTNFYTQKNASIQNEELSAPLFIKTSGDPSITTQDLWGVLYELRRKGIRVLNDVVVDRSVFGDVGIDPGAFDGEPLRPYNASPDAWVLGLGAVRVKAVANRAEKKWDIQIDPPLPYIQLGKLPAWIEGACPADARLTFERKATANGYQLDFPGNLRSGCDGLEVHRVIGTPRQHSEALFTWMWEQQGGTINGKFIYNSQTPSDTQLLVTHQSRPLAEVVRDINKLSNNLMARQLLLTIGAEYTSRPSTEEISAGAVKDILRSLGLSFPELVIENGAGLSRKARVSAKSLGALLDHAAASPVASEFISSLAIAGTDGTVRRRLRGADLQGNAHLKTGSLRNVRAIAGYVLTNSGKRMIVVIIINQDQLPDTRPFQDALIEWLVKK